MSNASGNINLSDDTDDDNDEDKIQSSLLAIKTGL